MSLRSFRFFHLIQSHREICLEPCNTIFIGNRCFDFCTFCINNISKNILNIFGCIYGKLCSGHWGTDSIIYAVLSHCHTIISSDDMHNLFIRIMHLLAGKKVRTSIRIFRLHRINHRHGFSRYGYPIVDSFSCLGILWNCVLVYQVYCFSNSQTINNHSGIILVGFILCLRFCSYKSSIFQHLLCNFNIRQSTVTSILYYDIIYYSFARRVIFFIRRFRNLDFRLLNYNNFLIFILHLLRAIRGFYCTGYTYHILQTSCFGIRRNLIGIFQCYLRSRNKFFDGYCSIFIQTDITVLPNLKRSI